MNTELFLDDPAEKRLRVRRFWYVGAFILVLLAVTTQQGLFFLAALLVMIVGLLPDWWYHHALRYLVVRQQLDQTRLPYAGRVTFSVTIENQKWFPLLWLSCEVQVRPLLPVYAEEQNKVGSIDGSGMFWSFQRVTRRYHLRSAARGLYTFGPLVLTSSDPLGWLKRQAVLPLRDTLLVYPLIVPIEALGQPLPALFGGGATPFRLFEDPLRVMGTRDYVPGDDPRRIHWKATARSGTLQSKVYEYQNQQCVLVLLDTGDEATALMKVSREMQEFAISTAASLTMAALNNGYQVGALINCALFTLPEPLKAGAGEGQREVARPGTLAVSAPGIALPFTRKRGHIEQLLATFARLAPATSMPMERLMEKEDALFTSGVSVLFVSVAETFSAPIVQRMLHIRRRGCRLRVLLTGELKGEKPSEMSAIPVHHLGGEKKWRSLVQSFEAERKGQANGAKLVRKLQLD
jgi:uncharacterized protein (DUF58 family)